MHPRGSHAAEFSGVAPGLVLGIDVEAHQVEAWMRDDRTQ
jgi:hypothetical protein